MVVIVIHFCVRESKFLILLLSSTNQVQAYVHAASSSKNLPSRDQ